MKELSIEEKAKRYDESIKRAKYLKENTDGVGAKDVSACFDYIFPELKEFEDERIRKALIDGFTVMKESKNCGKTFSNHNIPVADILAWLEKQGEKSVNKLQVSGKLYEHIRNTCACIDDALSSETLADINDYLSMAEHSAKSAFDMIEKQDELAEQSEEDDIMKQN